MRRNPVFGGAVCALALLLAACSDGQSDAGGARPQGEPMAADGAYRFQSKPVKTRRQISGIACDGDRCLIAFDEGAEARFAILNEREYRPDPRPILLRDDGEEVDAEGAAFDGERFYVTGSYAKKRKTCDDNPASRMVVRLDRDGGGRRTADLSQAIAAFPVLAAASKLCLDKGEGVDIEGLAVADGRLFFGFRGPTPHGEAQILSVDAAALFASPQGDLKPSLEAVEVGGKRGLRDMQAIDGGLLLLAGPDDDVDHQDTSWRVLFRKGGTTTRLAELDLSSVSLRRDIAGCDDEELKPEAMAIQSSGPNGFRIVILSDGMCDGAPLRFDVPRAP